MKYLKYILALVMLFGAFNINADEEVLNSYKKIQEVIQRVQAGERKALDDLLQIAKGEHPLELSDQIKATVIYGLTTTNQQAKLADFLKLNGMDAKSFYDHDKFKTGCKVCEGEGHSSEDCKACVFGKCKNCKGVGSIEYEGLAGEIVKSICTKCLGSKNCVKCDGTGEKRTDCPSCVKGDVFDRNSVFKEYVNSVKNIDELINKKISQMEKVDSVTNTEVDNKSTMKKNVNIEEDYKIKQNKNETQETPLEKLAEETEVDESKEISDRRLEASFNEVKKLIENHQNKHNLKICNDIQFQLQDNVPTIVLNLNDAFYENLNESRKDVIHNFEKFWEARAFLNGYRGKVGTRLVNKDKDVKDLLNSN